MCRNKLMKYTFFLVMTSLALNSFGQKIWYRSNADDLTLGLLAIKELYSEPLMKDTHDHYFIRSESYYGDDISGYQKNVTEVYAKIGRNQNILCAIRPTFVKDEEYGGYLLSDSLDVAFGVEEYGEVHPFAKRLLKHREFLTNNIFTETVYIGDGYTLFIENRKYLRAIMKDGELALTLSDYEFK